MLPDCIHRTLSLRSARRVWGPNSAFSCVAVLLQRVIVVLPSLLGAVSLGLLAIDVL